VVDNLGQHDDRRRRQEGSHRRRLYSSLHIAIDTNVVVLITIYTPTKRDLVFTARRAQSSSTSGQRVYDDVKELGRYVAISGDGSTVVSGAIHRHYLFIIHSCVFVSVADKPIGLFRLTMASIGSRCTCQCHKLARLSSYSS